MRFRKRICREHRRLELGPRRISQKVSFVHLGALRRWLLLLVAAMLMSAGAQPASPPVSTNKVSDASGAKAAAIPLAEVALQAESAESSLRTIGAQLSADASVRTVEEDLAVLTPEISARLDETSGIVSSSPSLSLLRKLGAEWRDLRAQLSGWERLVQKRATQLDGDATRLTRLSQTWELTRESGQSNRMPTEVLQRVTMVIGQTKTTLEQVEAQRALVLTLLNRLTEQDSSAAQALSVIELAREQVMSHLFVRDSPPIWSIAARSPAAESVVAEGRQPFTRQFTALWSYVNRKKENFFLHAVIFLAVAAGLAWAGRKMRRRAEAEAGPKHVRLIFDQPVSVALVLALLASGWIYRQAPRLLWAIIGAAALVPTTMVLRRLIDRRLTPILGALVVLYFVDQLRAVAAAQAVWSRWLFLAEMLGAAVFVLWLLRSARLSTVAVAERNLLWKTVRAGAWVALGFFSAAAMADALGYAGLSRFAGHACLSGADLALILCALVRIIDGLIFTTLTIPPLGRLPMIERHRELLQQRGRRLVGVLAILLWAFFVLDVLSLREPLFQDLRAVLTFKLGVGPVRLAPEDILVFAITVWAAFMLSRLLRFVLEEEVYPRAKLAPGIHYSVSRMLHYAILFLGFVTGLYMLGFDLTKLTILASAISVGLGFGLQNVVNNFVSGIILLFERPIKVGDLIQLDTTEGVVRRIGIRASIIRTASGSEIIVPNGKLISDPVTNWTLSDRERLIAIPITVASGVEPNQVVELLNSVAAAHPLVLKRPAPQSLCTSFGAGSLGFELRAWTDHAEDWLRIRSELWLAVSSALAAQNIAVR